MPFGLESGVQVIPGWEARLGNLQTGVGGAVELRAGSGLLHPWEISTKRNQTRFGLHILARAQLDYVAYNLVLSGNSPATRGLVRTRPAVPEFHWGAALRMARLNAEYRVVSRGEEYQGGPLWHRYGILTMAYGTPWLAQ
jgi:hypothetical protein